MIFKIKQMMNQKNYFSLDFNVVAVNCSSIIKILTKIGERFPTFSKDPEFLKQFYDSFVNSFFTYLFIFISYLFISYL